MAYKLTISDVVELPVKFTVNDAGKTVSHSFILSAKRMDQKLLRDTLNDSDKLTREVLQERVVGWRGQRLVVDENDAPADFSAEAFDCLLSLAGMEAVVLNAYLGALALADTSAGKAKN
jgi:hypothetical protein